MPNIIGEMLVSLFRSDKSLAGGMGVLTDVLAEVDPSHKVDIREEDPEQTTVRILEMLRILKYKPGPDTSSVAFRQALVQGDKNTIHPIIEWLFRNMTDLKKRAYLAQYLVKVEVPVDILSDADVSTLHEQYEQLMEDFKSLHKESEALKNSGYSTAELRSDLETMEREKDIVIKRIERMQKKVESVANREAMLSAAHTLRLEREREKELANQKQEQQTALNHAEQRVGRLQQQLKDARHASTGATSEGLLQRLEEETNVTTYIVKQKLPKELEARQVEVQILGKVLSEPAMGREDLDILNSKLQVVNGEINQLVERHLATKNPSEDKLAPFRQQAAIIARKKETTAELLGELRGKLTSLNDELDERQNQLKELAGEAVLGGEEFKRYVNKLRGRSSLYKRHRAELLALKAESGVLTRTIELLQTRNESVLQGLSAEEMRHGVPGFQVARQKLEQVSVEKAAVDQEKGKTLEDISSLVQQLSQRIASKKAQLAPIIKELRPLREQHQELSAEYEKKKKLHDTTAAGLESSTGKLEQEVKSLREELEEDESQCYMLEAQCVIHQVRLDRLTEEIKFYISSNPGDKARSLREQLSACINEQEKVSRQLKEQQQLVKENQTNRVRQVKLWSNLHKLLECKKKCLQEAQQNSGVVHRERGAETLILQ
uniref:IFT81 calponin homology domain-containing protein n=1 Tax=Timema shepardi TaxID=629360 RepID=A0A7R9AV34_TIMSH|nr:unnamed protein product [Timema shepardi]